MLVPKSFLEDLRSRVRLSDIVGKRIKLANAGREFKACCPFHNEKSPSFYVNNEKGFYHCFGCGAHGDIIGFLMRHENRGFMDAVEELAAQAGMQVPQPSPQEVERARGRDRLIEMMDKVTKYYCARLFEQKDILDYLTGRGLSLETIESFRLGYAPQNGQGLISELKAAGYNDAEMLDGGVTKKSDRDGSTFAFFRDRVMFPVTDRRGRTIAFGGRILPEHIRPLAPDAPKGAKYINSGETALFQKGHILYNESHARTAAARDNPIIVCEGYADVISVWQAGFTGAVAPLGTALTEAQIGTLWNMIPENAADQGFVRAPVLCFDGDAAGQRAALRAMERILPLLQAGLSARFAFLPDGMDPDDLIRGKGPEAFQNVIDAAIPLSDMIWRNLTANRRFDTPESRAALEKNIAAIVGMIADRSVQKQYQNDLKDRFYKAFSTKGRVGKKQVQKVHLPSPLARGRNDRARVALAAIINFPEIFAQAEDHLGRLTIDDPRLDDLRQNVMSYLSDTPDAAHEDLAEILGKQGFKEDLQAIYATARLHASSDRKTSNAEQALEGLREAVGGAR